MVEHFIARIIDALEEESGWWRSKPSRLIGISAEIVLDFRNGELAATDFSDSADEPANEIPDEMGANYSD